jgi:hypothetical protein
VVVPCGWRMSEIHVAVEIQRGRVVVGVDMLPLEPLEKEIYFELGHWVVPVAGLAVVADDENGWVAWIPTVQRYHS